MNSTLVPLAEYLSTSYRPDRDFLEGELLERNMGEQSHARVQLILAKIFDANRKPWGVRVSVEVRVQVREERFRVPDVCVLRQSDPFEEIVRRPPLLCIEVLSSADTHREIQQRVNDYAAMGVQNVWVIDPWKRLGYYASIDGFEPLQDGLLRIAGTPIVVSLAEVFAELDEA